MNMRILGYDYKVDLSKDLANMNGNAGLCNLDLHTIDIANDLPIDAKISTLLHEVIEAVNYHLELDMEHRQIMGIEVGIHQFLSENGVELGTLLMEKSNDGLFGKSGGALLLQAKDC